jgi:hypothetical protein
LPSISSETDTASFLKEVEEITKRERGRRLSIEAPGRLENLTEALTPELRKKRHGRYLFPYAHRNGPIRRN